MRPIRLEVQGLTSYKQPVSIDFTDLDLFAITGPTGSGKSSLVDAITYALFGQVPRVGRGIKGLISQGSDRMKVTLEFSAGGDTYRVHRSSALKGQSPIQLERLDTSDDAWKPLADKAADVTAQVEALLRLDYEAFIRSVLLPQGEFQEFLAGDRDQRRKVLDRLLRLGVYAAMQQKANALSAQERGEAEHIHGRLETELADATIESLASAQSELAALEQEIAEITKKRQALEKASRAAEALAAATVRAQKVQREAEQATAALNEARKTLSGGEKTIADLDIRIQDLRAKAKEADYDSDVHLKLTVAINDAIERDALEARLASLGVEGARIREDLDRLQVDAAAARTRVEAAQAAVTAAHDAFEGIRKTNAAVLLRSSLSPGDPCPVCGQAVGHLKAEKHGDFERVKVELDNARNEEKLAEKAATDVERGAAVLDERNAKLQQQLAEVKPDLERRAEALAAAVGDVGVATAELKSRVAAMDAAKLATETLARQEQELAAEREKSTKELAAAQAGVATLEAQSVAHEREAATAAKDAAEAQTEIERLATEHRWEDTLETLRAGGDVASIVQLELRRVEEGETAVNQGIGSGRTRIEQIKQNIALAEELRTKERQHAEAARLARDLATILRADALPAFVRDSAMQALAAGASGWLRKVSVGRYDLKVDGQDFAVSDILNAGEERPVQTLSGGETFLASLALALALAEQLPGMSSEGDTATLESLFIDEGFSHLDEETLKTVADALEVLGADKRRLIGVITHVNALAERLPARITVHKDSAGGPSTITVE